MESWSPAIWTGRWRWIRESAHYADPARKIVAQTADVLASATDFRINQKFRLTDGSEMSWTWDGKFDGVMRPIRWDHDGSEMIDIAFYWLRDGLGGDTYAASDASKTGSEVFRLVEGRLEVAGCYMTSESVQYPYREVWERMGD